MDEDKEIKTILIREARTFLSRDDLQEDYYLQKTHKAPELLKEVLFKFKDTLDLMERYLIKK